MVQSQLSRLLKYSVRFSRLYAKLTVNCTKVTLIVADSDAGELRLWNLDLLPEPVPVRPAPATLRVLVDKLNVRSGPSTDETVLAQVNTGTELTALDVTEDRNWLLVCCVNGDTGWVFNSAEYVDIANDAISQLWRPD